MTVNPELSERHNKELSAQLNQPRAMAGEGTTRSRTLGGSVTQSLASIVRALVSMHQESMRSSLSPAGDFKADSDWRGMRNEGLFDRRDGG